MKMNYHESYESPVLMTLELGGVGDIILCTSVASQGSITDMSVCEGMDNSDFEI